MLRGSYIYVVFGVAVLVMLVSLSGSGQSTEGAPDTELMFYIQRNVDDQRVHYVLNRDADGKVQTEDPFDVFWAPTPGEKERRRLNILQRRLVYGVNVAETRGPNIEFHIAAYPELSLFLEKSKDGYQVRAMIDGQWCVLERIHVELKNNNVFSPNVLFVRLEGVDNRGRSRTDEIRR